MTIISLEIQLFTKHLHKPSMCMVSVLQIILELRPYTPSACHGLQVTDRDTIEGVAYDMFLARLHEVHRAIVVTPVVHIPVPVRVTLALKFSRSPYLDNHSSESIHTWTIDKM